MKKHLCLPARHFAGYLGGGIQNRLIMGHKSKKYRLPDHHDPGSCKGTEPGTTDRRSWPGDTSPSSPRFWTHNTRTAAAVCGFLLLAVALVFGQTVKYDFTNYDDNEYVYDNPQVVQGLTARGIAWAFTTVHASNWHPLTWLSHMLDCQIYGLKAGGHHLTNVLLHAAVVIVLFLVLWRMTGFLWRSAFVAAVFAVHPLRAESVAWVAERKDVLSGLFFMLILWAYVGYARRSFSSIRYLAVAVLFVLGLMSKPMLVTLPFVLLLLDYWPLGRLGLPSAVGGSFPFSRRVVVEKLPLLALTAVSCVATFIAQGKAVVPVDAIPMSARIANAFVSYVAYIGDLFYPVGLAVFYPLSGSGFPIWKVVASTLALAGISAAALVWRRRFPYLFVGWFWYLGMMVPVIGLVQVGSHAMADRYTYLPQIGLVLSLTWGVAQLAASWGYRRRWACGVAPALAVLVLMGITWRQTSYWQDSKTLWTNALACTADNDVAQNNLGLALAGRGQIDAAIPHFQKALGINPVYAKAINNLGNALVNRGQVDAAIAHYQRALEIKPDNAETLNNLGRALARRGQIKAAIAHLQKALEIKPDYAEVHNNLGIALARSGQTDAAIAHLQKALEIKPGYAEAHNNLGNALAGQGQVDMAIAHFQKALEIKPDYEKAYNNLGYAMASRGQIDAAIAYYQQALKIMPDYAAARYNLGQALQQRAQNDRKRSLQVPP
jgi:tetratricopeptide (TPR) repeat protein